MLLGAAGPALLASRPLALRQARRRNRAGCPLRGSQRRRVVRPPVRDSGVVEIERAERVRRTACVRRASSRTPTSGGASSTRVSTRSESWSDPGRRARRGRPPRREPGRARRARFDERFLALPERVIVTAMQSHQRYFPLGGARFAFVANGGDPELVRAGNERVLEGRLEDAAFTFERDVRRGIDGLAGELGTITFVAGAGSMADKTRSPRPARDGARRRRGVSRGGAPRQGRPGGRARSRVPGARGLTSGPSTRGLAGYPQAVCQAIEEQYLPDSAGGPLPETEAGRVLAVAERIDNLAVAFALGERPSGTRDPYGLRRAAIGLCRLAVVELVPDRRARARRRSHTSLLVEQGAEVSAEPPDDVRRLRRRAARGPPGGAGRVRACGARLRHHAARPDGRARRRAGDGSGADARRRPTVYTRASRLRRKGSRPGGAEPSTPGFSSRTQSAKSSAHSTSGARRSRLRAGRATSTRRWPRQPSSEPPLERFFEDVLVMAEDTAPCARTVCASCSTCATRSAVSATSRRYRADDGDGGPESPIEIHIVSDATGETATRVVHGGRAAVPRPRVRGDPPPAGDELRRRPARRGAGARAPGGDGLHARRPGAERGDADVLQALHASTTAICSAIRSKRSRACPACPAKGEPGALPVLDSTLLQAGRGDRVRGPGRRRRRRAAARRRPRSSSSGCRAPPRRRSPSTSGTSGTRPRTSRS